MLFPLAIASVFAVLARSSNPPPASPSNVCCASLITASAPAAAEILGQIGVMVQDGDTAVGLFCTEPTVIGDSASCNGQAQQRSCQDNSHAGLIAIGCVPVTS
ncbi:hydrophobin [Mycena latifolia]|nr:hydrophobin [Mycena latifolia]